MVSLASANEDVQLLFEQNKVLDSCGSIYAGLCFRGLPGFEKIVLDLTIKKQNDGSVPSSGGNSTIETEIDITSVMLPLQSAVETFVRSIEPWIPN